MKQFNDILNLKEGEDDRARTLENVKKNIEFKGANLWILACAIIVASVGLNVNSTAVIIGAMLISPLMGPILGAGFALGIYDFKLLKKSLKNLLNATLVSLTVSTLYFYLSPFKDVQSELLARTSPNIYDILIAFFGGIVGVIAITRSEKGNPIPGVAIATALMPPLCTAGYGIATAQWSFFFGAFYLYCINCVFIGIATFLIIKYLNYPAVKQVNEKQQKRVKFIIAFLITAMLLPSGYLAFSLYREQQFKKNVELFIEKEFSSKGYTVVYKKTDFNPKKKKIELAFLSKRFDSLEMKALKNKINKNQYLKGAHLLIRQDTTDRFNALKGDILNQIKGSENEMNSKDVKIMQLEKQLALNKFDNKQLLKESRALFPNIVSLSITKTTIITQKDSLIPLTAVIYESPRRLSQSDQEKLRNWLNQRLSVKDVELFKKQ
ncbi:putative hydrophobic protein (TIGR00341 family) [Flavobacterium chryseum]|uniref:TIGR00341 family protein n=1 Tax=Flavobacterium sp. P3160 TaxID=2512113 RepID=UPI00105CC553|nr:TIGR00341 family protein [Flavobacterium sp. P3160]TDO82807.1 putative hydrophobic protein (TIGR00341 family) [Flavobacterium sp. P3160]